MRWHASEPSSGPAEAESAVDPDAGRGAHDEQQVRATIAGGNPLRGSYRTPGAKNVVLPMMAACLLTDETCVIQNVPTGQTIAFRR